MVSNEEWVHKPKITKTDQALQSLLSQCVDVLSHAKPNTIPAGSNMSHGGNIELNPNTNYDQDQDTWNNVLNYDDRNKIHKMRQEKSSRRKGRGNLRTNKQQQTSLLLPNQKHWNLYSWL